MSAYNSEKFKEKTEKRRQDGVCLRCAKPKDNETTLCNYCRDKHRKYVSKLKKKNKEENKCVRCGKPRDNITIYCSGCRAENRLRFIRVRETRKLNNRCIGCGKPLLERHDIVQCINCNEKTFIWK